VVLVLAFFYPILASLRIPKTSLLFAILSLIVFESTGQESAKYRVRAVKADHPYVFVADSTKVLKPEDSVWVSIPKVFTPDGDGLHDVFLPQHRNCTYLLIDLYTRQGEYIVSLKKDEVWKGLGKSQSYIWLGQWKDKAGNITYRSGIVVELQPTTK
jgi:hypothetical protein